MSNKITNIHLSYGQYSEEILINSIDQLSVYSILITQDDLSKDFINK